MPRPIRVGKRVARIVGPKQSGVVIRSTGDSHYVQWEGGKKSWVPTVFIVREDK